ncbi:hypothetical protein [Paenibacillus ginsengarvi]|uniref:Uncharacterized protein n=1 Tax=Paenibacillus ginsengarvi TaxID=400777 RepID=A0A3B0BRM9_9BACL|nr:hypothetical protein [Paenibacillus ginsengarvi]RKN74998.1 hypothetical protein D7M11_26030 [Paenibacillus ginsengarvi]
MIETIKSYLVSLGFAVDKSSYQNATKAIGDTGKTIAGFAGRTIKHFASAAAAIASFVVAANVGIAKFIGELAKADLENEKLARQMWTSKDNAAAFNNSLKALGATLDDLYLSPELMRNFQQLNREAQSLQVPEEFGEQMKLIRSVQFEFARMKLGATYALQWIGYYFIKYMETPIRSIKATLSEMNDVIFKEMPSWTKVIAQVMSWFSRMGVAAFRTIKDVIRLFAQLGKAIPDNVKIIGAAVAGLAVILSTGPIGIFVAALIGVLLLLDDFYGYIDGKDAALGPVWQKLIDFFQMLNGEGITESIKERFKGAMEGLSVGIDKAKEGVKQFYKDLVDKGAIDNYKETMSNVGDILSEAFSGTKRWLNELYDKMEDKGVIEGLRKSVTDVITSVSELDKNMTGFIKNALELESVRTILGGIGTFLQDVIIVSLRVISDLLEAISGYIDHISAMFGGTLGEKLQAEGKDAAERLEPKNQGKSVWGKLGTAFKSMFTGYFTGDTTFADYGKITAGRLFGTPSYVNPTTQNTTTQNVELNQTNHFYGTDPKATAEAVDSKFNALYNSRNRSGVIQ